ncbi:MAG: hypothetical protein EHM23_25255 [Acidobacteria bacterium]|nr:MAG: hypothetical protein EHM23_25255 [Acidobacteriota bacterium]
MSSHEIPEIWLERFLLDELPPNEAEQVRRAVASDPVVAQKLDQLRQSGEELLRRYPPGLFTAKIRDRMPPAEPRRAPAVRSVFFSPVSLALLSVMVIAGLSLPFFRQANREAPPTQEGVRGKGDETRLLVFLKTAEGVRQLSNGAKVGRNDIVQLSYYSAGQKYGVILSLDGQGSITQHLPEQGAQAPALSKGRATPLPSAFRLDEAPTGEIFFFVTSNQPFPVQLVRDAMRTPKTGWDHRSRRLSLPAGYQQSTVMLEKEETR